MKNLLLICKLLLIAEFVMAQSNWSPIGPVGSPSVLPDTDNQDGTGRLHLAIAITSMFAAWLCTPTIRQSCSQQLLTEFIKLPMAGLQNRW